MKHKFSYLWLIFAVMIGGALSGCSDDEETLKESLKAPTTTLEEQSYNKLKFKWESVANAIQYGYVLTNPSGNVVGEGTTVYNTASFTGLLPNTEYVLSVWAFPSTESDYSTSPSFTLTASTDPLKAVPAPQPVWSKSGNRITVSWEDIAQASSYTYILSGPGIASPEEIETIDTSVSFVGLEIGDFEFTIYANSMSAGYETKSQSTTIVFTVEALKDWRALGTLYYGYDYSDDYYPAILSYDNATDVYTILNWCNVEGYNFSFTLTEDGLDVYGSGESSYGYYQVATGLEDPSYLNVYCANGYSTFEGDMNSGEIWIGYYTPDWKIWDYMSFIWDAESSHPSIDDICGSYTYKNWGYEYYTTWGTWNEFSYDNQSCTITKIDDNNVWFSTLLSYPGFEGCGFEAEYNPQNLTLYAPIQKYAEYYTLGKENDDYSNGTPPDEGVTAYIQANGSISMDDWVIYYEYGGWWYKYFAYDGSYWSRNTAKSAPAAKRCKRIQLNKPNIGK